MHQRSSVGVGYPSPVKTWPRWESHAAQRVRERQVRDAVPDLGALAAQHHDALARGVRGDLGDQPGLADAGITADQRANGTARPWRYEQGVVEQGKEPPEFSLAPYQCRHAPIIPSARPGTRFN